MRGFVKWGSIMLLSGLAIVAVWSGITGPGRPSGNRQMGQSVRYVQPLPGAGTGGGAGSDTGQTPGNRSMGMLQDVRRVAESVPGVKKAWPVQTGNDFLIGVELDLKSRNVSDVESTVAQQVKGKVPGVDNIRVTTQPTQVTRIRKITQSVALGRPTANYARDIADLWRTAPITPKSTSAPRT